MGVPATSRARGSAVVDGPAGGMVIAVSGVPNNQPTLAHVVRDGDRLATRAIATKRGAQGHIGAVARADLDGDGIDEIITPDDRELRRFDPTTLIELAPVALDPRIHWMYPIHVVDLDGDGRDEVTFSGPGAEVGAMDSDGALIARELVPNAQELVAIEVDGDPLPELFDRWSGRVYDSPALTEILYPQPAGGGCLLAVDIDHDGVHELVCRGPGGLDLRTVLSAQTLWTYAPVSDIEVITIADIGHDGEIDVLIREGGSSSPVVRQIVAATGAPGATAPWPWDDRLTRVTGEPFVEPGVSIPNVLFRALMLTSVPHLLDTATMTWTATQARGERCDGPWLADMDGGGPTLIFAGEEGAEARNPATLDVSAVYPTFGHGTVLDVHDLDGDGLAEILSRDGSDAPLLISRIVGGVQTAPWEIRRRRGCDTTPDIVEYADLDGDGTDEIFFASTVDDHFGVIHVGSRRVQWCRQVSNNGNLSGATLVDFDGNGMPEAWVTDEVGVAAHSLHTGRRIGTVVPTRSAAFELAVAARPGHPGLSLVYRQGTSAWHQQLGRTGGGLQMSPPIELVTPFTSTLDNARWYGDHLFFGAQLNRWNPASGAMADRLGHRFPTLFPETFAPSTADDLWFSDGFHCYQPSNAMVP